LDHDRVVAALVATNVNITAAARKLHVPTSDLRHLVYVSPELLSLAIDKEERRLDKAEEILDRELNSSDPRYSAAAAFFVLRNARRAVARGWRQPDVEVAVNNSGPPADLPLAAWKLRIGLETLERQRRGELFCLLCDSLIALDPPLVGFIRGDD